MSPQSAATRRRMALNEARARQLNQARSENWIDDRAPASFWCECADPGCSALVQLTMREWGEVRAEATQFVVSPGHTCDDLGSVAERREAYWIVVKQGDPQETIAERTDPAP